MAWTGGRRLGAFVEGHGTTRKMQPEVTDVESLAKGQDGTQSVHRPWDDSDQKSGNTKYRANEKRRRTKTTVSATGNLRWAQTITALATDANNQQIPREWVQQLYSSTQRNLLLFLAGLFNQIWSDHGDQTRLGFCPLRKRRIPRVPDRVRDIISYVVILLTFGTCGIAGVPISIILWLVSALWVCSWKGSQDPINHTYYSQLLRKKLKIGKKNKRQRQALRARLGRMSTQQEPSTGSDPPPPGGASRKTGKYSASDPESTSSSSRITPQSDQPLRKKSLPPLVQMKKELKAIGVGGFDGNEATQYFKYFDIICNEQSYPEENRLELLLADTRSWKLHMAIQQCCASAKNWKDIKEAVKFNFRQGDSQMKYTPEQRKSTLLTHTKIKSMSSLYKFLVNYNEILVQLGEREAQGHYELWAKIPRKLRTKLRSEYGLKESDLAKHKFPHMYEKLMELIVEDDQETKLDEQARHVAPMHPAKEAKLAELQASLNREKPGQEFKSYLTDSEGGSDSDSDRDSDYDLPKRTISPGIPLALEGAHPKKVKAASFNPTATVIPPAPILQHDPYASAMDDLKQQMEKLRLDAIKVKEELLRYKSDHYDARRRSLNAPPGLQVNSMQIDPDQIHSMELEQSLEANALGPLRRDGSTFACYACGQKDHSANNCSVYQTLQDRGICYWDGFSTFRVHLGDVTAFKQGRSRPLDAEAIKKFRSQTGGAVNYILGCCEADLIDGRNDPWIQAYKLLKEEDPKYTGRAELRAALPTIWEANNTDQSRPNAWVSSGAPKTNMLNSVENTISSIKYDTVVSPASELAQMVKISNIEVDAIKRKVHDISQAIGEQPKTVDDPENRPKPSDDKKQGNINNLVRTVDQLAERFITDQHKISAAELISLSPEFLRHYVARVQGIQNNAEKIEVVSFDREEDLPPPKRRHQDDQMPMVSAISIVPDNYGGKDLSPPQLEAIRALTRGSGTNLNQASMPTVSVIEMYPDTRRDIFAAIQATERIAGVASIHALDSHRKSTCPVPQILVSVESGKEKLPAALDSGAEINLIGSSLVQKYSIPFTKMDPEARGETRTFDGGSLPLLGICAATLRIGSCTTEVLFMIVNDETKAISHNILLGMPFFIQTRLNFDHGSNGRLGVSLIIGRTQLVVPVHQLHKPKRPLFGSPLSNQNL